jgi:glycosyltransferase 2 family protein
LSLKDLLIILFKVTVTLGTFIYLLTSINPQTLLSAFLHMSLLPLLLCVPIIVAMYAIRTEKWKVLLESVGVRIPFFTAARIFLIGTFYGSVTPGRAGEISRSYFMDEKRARTIPTILVDRATDIAVLLSISLIIVLLFLKSYLLSALVLGMALVFSAIAVLLLHDRLVSLVFPLFGVKGEHIDEYTGSVNFMLRDGRTMCRAFLLTIMYYALNIVVFALILRSMSPGIDVWLALSLPVIVIMGNIPVSISGLGVRELVSATVFTLLSSSPSYGFTSSLLLFAMTSLLPGMAGGVFLLQGGELKRIMKVETS